MSSSSKQNEAPAFSWDPKNPAALLLPQLEEDGKLPAVVETVLALRGVSCNDHELTALMKIIQNHQEYFENEEKEAFDASRKFDALKTLSQKYRGAVRDCLAEWDSDGVGSKEEEESLELLKGMYTLMHLSDVFLPLLPAYLGRWEGPFDSPGAATADVVRFLRYNLMQDTERLDPDVPEMLESAYPEQFGDGTLYWELVETLVARGCLDKAWSVLERHSAYTQAVSAFDEGGSDVSYIAGSLDDIRTEFLALRDIFVRAPLPAGRSDDYDDALGTPDWNEGLEETDYYTDDLDVKPSDYKYWEVDLSSRGTGDYPVNFSQEAALYKYRTWQEYVKERRPSFRIPQFDSILAVLSGDVSTARCRSWAERLCAELLYRRPDLRPRDLSARTRGIMEAFSEGDSDSPINRAILSIMDGNAGKTIEMMLILGGASGAALPTTMTSLLYNLYMESDILPPEASFRRTELLCDAASAIVSSLDDSGTNLGVPLAIRLLVPYAERDGDRQVVASIAEILDHHAPASDADARTLLSLCRPLVEMKSAHVLDGCSSVVLCRYRHHMEENQQSDAMYWLLTGIELEALILPLKQLGSCYRTLQADCFKTTKSLLQGVLGEDDFVGQTHVVAEAMVEGLQGGSFDAGKILEAELLMCVLSIFNRVSSGENATAASQIVACLESRTDEATGVRGPLANSSFHWDLLRIAQKILVQEEREQSESETVFAVFDKSGIAVLMERLMQISALSDGFPPEDQLQELRKVLAKGLARAFVAENAKKKLSRVDHPWRNKKVEGFRSTNLDRYSVTDQEQAVQKMLSY